jgi:hypothetical protein
MTPIEALNLLGSKRVIWIDDRFATASAEKLVGILIEHTDIALQVCSDALKGPLRKINEGDETGNAELNQAVANLEVNDSTALLRAVLKEAEKNGLNDLPDEQIASVCEHLSIAAQDRWSFDGAEAQMLALAKDGGDAEICYVIDLNDALGATENLRGLELIRSLHEAESKATAFLLTHFATKTDEAEKELALRHELSTEALGVAPVCVIAKQRLYAVGDGDLSQEGRHNAVAEALRIAIKRAGLRRNVHDVLVRVQNHIDKAFKAASNDLLAVPPEQLDEYVVGRAHAEGVSELHVVERALTASMSESFRHLFSVDTATRRNEQRLRSLRSIPLGADPPTHHEKLESFRRQEVWEPEELVNKGASPLACGDVFELTVTNGTRHRFILLVQPCDVTLRPNGDRDVDAGFLIQLKEVPIADDAPKLKQIRLPFLLEGKQWACELRKTTSVRLALLDLVSFRADGRLQYDEGQTAPEWVLPGQRISGTSVLSGLKKAYDLRVAKKGAPASDEKDARCQLTLSASGPFQHIAHGTFVTAIPAIGDVPAVSGGYTWNLRRIGRVRMPYASSLLGSYLSVMDRDAFDLDYLKPRPLRPSDPASCGACS